MYLIAEPSSTEHEGTLVLAWIPLNKVLVDAQSTHEPDKSQVYISPIHNTPSNLENTELYYGLG